MLKDFDIAAEAGGTGKPLMKKFFANVTKSTRALEIRFYWAGKGTTIIPENGVYGVLISAISIHHSKLYTFVNNKLAGYTICNLILSCS